MPFGMFRILEPDGNNNSILSSGYITVLLKGYFTKVRFVVLKVINLNQSLARAIYARKNIVILDDILSGLDADTENRIFNGLLGRQGLLKNQNVTVCMSSSSCK